MTEATTNPAAPAIAGHYSQIVLPEPPPDRPYVLINMVTSVDGKATLEGSERGLGSADDKRGMQELRSLADAVMNGANTLRISGSSPVIQPRDLRARRRERGLAEQPLGVVVSSSGYLPLESPFFTSTKFRAVVFLTESTPAERVKAVRATGRPVEVVPDGEANAIHIVRILRERYGVRYLLCEGGPTLNRSLFAAGAVDELYLTLAPWIVAGSGNLTAVEGTPYTRETMPRLHLQQQLHDKATDELYLRYRVEFR